MTAYPTFKELKAAVEAIDDTSEIEWQPVNVNGVQFYGLRETGGT